MYLTKKKISGKEYYYLRESVRKGKKVISRNIAYLGADKKEADEKMGEIINKINNKKVLKENKQKIVMKDIQIPKSEQKVAKKLTIDELATFCKRKGFVFKSSEIYGGMAGFW